MTLQVEPPDGEPYEIAIRAVDVYKWEGNGSDRAISDVQARQRLADFAELAYYAARRLQKTAMSLGEWLDTMDVTASDETAAEAADPIPPAA